MSVRSEDHAVLSHTVMMDFNLFADDSLTVDNVTKVMEMVTADWIKEVWQRLDVPESLVKMITRKLSLKEKTRACVDLYLNCYPYGPSWNAITSALAIPAW